MGWARSGAPAGSLVVAAGQIAPRSRPRRPWPAGGANSVSFTLICRPRMTPSHAGILYLAATAGLADALGPTVDIEWPDELYAGDRLLGLLSVHLEQTVRGLEWALINVMLTEVEPPRAAALTPVIEAVERRCSEDDEALVAAWTPRCRTLGRSVSALLYPIGREHRVAGQAVGVRPSGALVVEERIGGTRAIRPHQLAAWES